MNYDKSALIDLSWIDGNRTSESWNKFVESMSFLGDSGIEKNVRKAVSMELLSPNSGSLKDLYLLERLFEFDTLLLDGKALHSSGLKIPEELSSYIRLVTPSEDVYKRAAAELCERINEIPEHEKKALGNLDYLPKTRYFDDVWSENQGFPSALANSGNSNDWIRAIFYLTFSKQLGSLLMLSGEKSRYLNTISNTCTNSQHEVVRKIFDGAFSDKLREYYPDEESLWTIYTNQTPPIIEYVLERAVETDTNALEVVEELRASNEAVEYRDLLSQLRSYSEGSRKSRIEAMKIAKSLDIIAKAWSSSLDIDQHINYLPRKVKLKKLPLVGNILEMASLDELELKDYFLSSPPGYLVFCASWYREGFNFGESDGLVES